MKYTFYVDYDRSGSGHFETYEAAEKHLKIRASKEQEGDTWAIYKAVAFAEVPLPEIKVVPIA